jgi:hypothetical protein
LAVLLERYQTMLKLLPRWFTRRKLHLTIICACGKVEQGFLTVGGEFCYVLGRQYIYIVAVVTAFYNWPMFLTCVCGQ